MSTVRRAAAPLPLLLLPFTLALTACAKPADQASGTASAPAATAVATTADATPSDGATAAAAGAEPAAGAATPVAPASSEFNDQFLAGGTVQKSASGIEYVDVVPGTGAELKAGVVGELDFDGWLGNGTSFDSSAQHDGPFCYEVGGMRGVAFFNEGLAGMKVGSTRRFRVPPELGYGTRGRPPFVPPNSTLLFEMRLKDVREVSKKPDVSGVAFKTTPSGLKWADVTVGTGGAVVAGGSVKVSYSGFLDDGTKFDSSRDRCDTFDVENVGKASVIAGWNEGLLGMKTGGRRILVIPGNLAYGEMGRQPIIPANATLTFDVEALEVTAPPPPPEPMNFPDVSKLNLTTTSSGLKWADVRPGEGPEVKAGSTADMHYTGWLEDGNKFDSSLDRGTTFAVANVGNAGVIAGWNEGLQGMKQGGRRVLVIPANLGYGERGSPPVIPADATLVFMIDAVRVR